MRSIMKELSRTSTDKVSKEGLLVLKSPSKAGVIFSSPRTHHSVPVSKENSSQDIVSSEIKEVTPPASFRQQLQQRHREFEGRYKHCKEETPATHEFLLFLLKNGVYGSAIWLANEVYVEYQKLQQQLSFIEQTLDKYSDETRQALEKMRALQAQPLLYLTTQLSAQDQEDYRKQGAICEERLKQFKQYQEQLQVLISKQFTFASQFKGLVDKATSLKTTINTEIEQLEIVKSFNEVIWQHKNRYYQTALDTLNPLLQRLEQSPEQSVVFLRKRILTAAYNTQAKLHACLARSGSGDAKAHSDASLASYNRGIDLLAVNPKGYEVDIAILKSSKAYLLGDGGEHEEALKLHREANTLKPGDPHIVCGIGQDLYNIEQGKPEGQQRDRSKLNEAYAYLSRAIQHSEQIVPNIYLTRAKVLLALGDPKAALADCECALERDKHHSGAKLQKSHILLQQGHCKAASRFFKEGLVPLIGNPDAIAQKRADFKGLKERINSRCPESQDEFFEPLQDEVESGRCVFTQCK